MNATVDGEVWATDLTRSSVGPHWALWQKAGVAKTSTNGVLRASASATETL